MEFRDRAGNQIVAKQRLSIEQLRADFSQVTFASFKPIAAGALRPPGQQRALGAIRLAVGMRRKGFNLFVSGQAGSGRHELVRSILREEGSLKDPPSDWVYLNNFDQPEKPIALELPAGKARPFKCAMEELIDDLANDIPANFESEAYQAQRKSIEQEFAEAHESAFDALVSLATERGLILLRTPMGFMVAAEKDGKPMKPEEFRALPEPEQAKIDKSISEVQGELEKVLKAIPQREKEHRKAVESLNAEIAQQSVDASLGEVEAGFAGLPGVKHYLNRVRADLTENAALFLLDERAPQAGAFPVSTTKHYLKPQFARYSVNAIIARSDEAEGGVPIIEERLPSLPNLIGRIEHEAEMGTLVTNFTMIKAGALHRANGGYLILDAIDIVSEPFAWDALKRCLKTEAIKITSLQERLSLITTTSLDPDPIPLSVRIILIGERMIFYLLSLLDPEFPELFKVHADFEDSLNWTDEALAAFAIMLRGLAAQEGCLEVSDEAVRSLMFEATRMAEDASKLSLNLGHFQTLLAEADFIARGKKKAQIGSAEISEAIRNGEERAGRSKERLQEAISRNILMVDTDGAVSGQINALSVVGLGDARFGRPSRLTATVRPGRGKLVDIEREVELGGPLHSKGVMILSAYLASHFALAYPLSLSATLVFEQSYSGVDGDSASAAELICLLSALAEVPIDQSFAITGSVNQKGEIQAIGGVNEKIEGFFDLCNMRGLTGKQGVIIPAANVQHLALRQRVVEAVDAGRFGIFPIVSVNDGIEILTGLQAGTPGEDGRYPDGSINNKVDRRLIAFAKEMRAYVAQRRDGSVEENTL